ncbi:hypothetical protein PybrP1_000183, partial [[Pythium] brassicae (nom. inval.)]
MRASWASAASSASPSASKCCTWRQQRSCSSPCGRETAARTPRHKCTLFTVLAPHIVRAWGPCFGVGHGWKSTTAANRTPKRRDLTNNLIASTANASLPATLKMLNLTRNPIQSLKSLRLPPKLQHLYVASKRRGQLPVDSVASLMSLRADRATRNLVGASLEELANFSFPSSLKSLNLSGNPIARIAGVVFPAALTQLAIKVGYGARLQVPATSLTAATSTGAAAPPALVLASPALMLTEFEVRRTDAERFKKLQLFDVSKTSTVKCSDPLAKYFYVNDTMLCVLSDDDFVAKYARVVSAASSTDGDVEALVPSNTTAAARATERPLLHETWHQSRSWFLATSAALLSAFVLVVAVAGCVRASARRAARAFTARKGSELGKSRAALGADNADAPAACEKASGFDPEEAEKLLALPADDTVDNTEASASAS